MRLADLAALVVSLGSDDCLEEVAEVLEVLAQRNVHLVREPDPSLHGQSRRAEVETILVATQSDRADADIRLEMLEEMYGDQFEFIVVSAEDPDSLEPLRRRLFELLDVVRVVTKPKGKEPEWGKPFTLPRGATVEDLARHIHKDLAVNLRFARIWGQGYHDGMRVPRDHVLHDMDVIEINA